MRNMIVAAIVTPMSTMALAQQPYYFDPQAVINSLIQKQLRDDAQRQRNEAMRLELERLDLEKQLHYRRLSDAQLIGEVERYCPKRSSLPCTQQPPKVLLAEAANRGLISFARHAPVPPTRIAWSSGSARDEG